MARPCCRVLLLLFLPLLLALHEVLCANSFRVYWNVPSHLCAKFGIHINVSQYGIVQNKEDAFYGDKVNILYRPGAFPYLKGDEQVWGGIPQNGSVATHLQRFINKVNDVMPLDYAGIAVLDFEDYYPSYAPSLAAYKVASREWARSLHPDETPAQVEALAEEAFNSSSKVFFQSLLWVGREMRPSALWGYYHYPYCHNYSPQDTHCSPGMVIMNEKIRWLYEGSSALYPSFYIFRYSNFSPRSHLQHVRKTMLNTLRVRRRYNPSAVILPYLWYRYHDSPVYLTPIDMVITLGEAKLMGSDGAVMWGGNKDVETKEQCANLKRYSEMQVGPLVRYLAHLPRAKLRRLLASSARLKRAMHASLRKVRRRQQRTPYTRAHNTICGDGNEMC